MDPCHASWISLETSIDYVCECCRAAPIRCLETDHAHRCRSDMSGFMQNSFFFGYMAVVCFGFFIMLGAVGWRFSLTFVRHIYHAIKCE
jgi:hypothetical protein